MRQEQCACARSPHRHKSLCTHTKVSQLIIISRRRRRQRRWQESESLRGKRAKLFVCVYRVSALVVLPTIIYTHTHTHTLSINYAPMCAPLTRGPALTARVVLQQRVILHTRQAAKIPEHVAVRITLGARLPLTLMSEGYTRTRRAQTTHMIHVGCVLRVRPQRGRKCHTKLLWWHMAYICAALSHALSLVAHIASRARG